MEYFDYLVLTIITSMNGDLNDLIEAREKIKLTRLREILSRFVCRLDCGQYFIKIEKLLSSLRIHDLMEESHE